MAWTTPRTWTDSETVTSSIMNTHLRDNFSFLAGEPAELWVRRTADQSISDTTQTPVVWQAEDRDVGFNWSASTATVTIPETGIYTMTANLQWGGAGAYNFVGLWTSSDSTMFAGCGGDHSLYNEGNQKSVSETRRMTSGTSIQVIAYQNSGGSLDVQYDGGGPTTFRICQVQRTTS